MIGQHGHFANIFNSDRLTTGQQVHFADMFNADMLYMVTGRSAGSFCHRVKH